MSRPIREAYNELVDALSLKQFRPLMVYSSYADKARGAKAVSRSKRIHALADEIIAIAAEMEKPSNIIPVQTFRLYQDRRTA